MFSRLVSIALVLVVLGCPLWCNLGLCCATTNDMAKSSCCQCCHENAPSEDSSSSPAPCQEEQDGKPCQGICGGALLSGMVEVARDVQPTDWLDASVTLSAHDSVVVSNRTAASPPDERALSGRMICCLHMTFLC